MSFRFRSPHKIRTFLSITVILCGLVAIGFLFTPYGNPPQCGEGNTAALNLEPPNCIVGANIGAGIILFFALVIIWLGILGLLVSFTYRAKQLQQPGQRWLVAATAIVLITPFILWHFFITVPGNEANKIIEQEEAGFQAKYRSDFIAYDTPPNWKEVTKESTTVAYAEDYSLALYLNQCETGKSKARYLKGSTYFVFSGIKDSDCIFYVHTQSSADSTWGGLLRTKCIWGIDSDNDNTPIFSAGPSGIKFGDFLTKHCSQV